METNKYILEPDIPSNLRELRTLARKYDAKFTIDYLGDQRMNVVKFIPRGVYEMYRFKEKHRNLNIACSNLLARIQKKLNTS